MNNLTGNNAIPQPVNVPALVNQIVSKRTALAELEAEMKAAKAKFAEDTADLAGRLATARASLNEDEDALRAEGLRVFAQTRDKKPLAGVGIRVGVSFVYDEIEALAWAESHAPILVEKTLNVQGFKSFLAPLPNKPAFVKVVETPTATVASKLEPIPEGEIEQCPTSGE